MKELKELRIAANAAYETWAAAADADADAAWEAYVAAADVVCEAEKELK